MTAGGPPVWRKEARVVDAPGTEKFFRLTKLEGADSPEEVKQVADAVNEALDALASEIVADDQKRDAQRIAVRKTYLNTLTKIGDAIVAGRADGTVETVRKSRDDYATALALWTTKGLSPQTPSAAQDKDDEGSSRPSGQWLMDLVKLSIPSWLELGKEVQGRADLDFAQLPEGATPEQQSLLVELIRAKTVVEIVLDRRTNLKEQDRESLRAFYFSRLKAVADIGLSDRAGPVYAQKRLDVFKENFVAREADAVKNQHVARLGAWAAGFASVGIALGIVFVFTANYFSVDVITHVSGTATKMSLFLLLSNFAFLCVGAACGTWLSFSLRRVTLGFSDLATLEEDRLNPFGRIVFVMLLSCVLGLLLETKLMTIDIGTTHVLVSATPLMALVLGALCGIAERSLSGVVSRRASDVIEAGGGRPPGTNGASS